MSELHSETAPLPCPHTGCICEIVPGTGFLVGDVEFCSEACADPERFPEGCQHEGCNCGIRK